MTMKMKKTRNTPRTSPQAHLLGAAAAVAVILAACAGEAPQRDDGAPQSPDELLSMLKDKPLPGARVQPAFRPGQDTFQQLEALARTHGERYDLHLLLGEDAFLTLPRWRGHERVLALMNLLVSMDRARLGRAPPVRQILGAAGAAYRPRGKAEHVDPRSGRASATCPPACRRSAPAAC